MDSPERDPDFILSLAQSTAKHVGGILKLNEAKTGLTISCHGDFKDDGLVGNIARALLVKSDIEVDDDFRCLKDVGVLSYGSEGNLGIDIAFSNEALGNVLSSSCCNSISSRLTEGVAEDMLQNVLNVEVRQLEALDRLKMLNQTDMEEIRVPDIQSVLTASSCKAIAGLLSEDLSCLGVGGGWLNGEGGHGQELELRVQQLEALNNLGMASQPEIAVILTPTLNYYQEHGDMEMIRRLNTIVNAVCGEAKQQGGEATSDPTGAVSCADASLSGVSASKGQRAGI